MYNISDDEIIVSQLLLLNWYDKNRKNYPWRYIFALYKVLIS